MMMELDAEMKSRHEAKMAAFMKTTEEQVSSTKTRLESITQDALAELETHIEETAQIAASKIAGIDASGKVVKDAMKSLQTNPKAKAA